LKASDWLSVVGWRRVKKVLKLVPASAALLKPLEISAIDVTVSRKLSPAMSADLPLFASPSARSSTSTVLALAAWESRLTESFRNAAFCGRVGRSVDPDAQLLGGNLGRLGDPDLAGGGQVEHVAQSAGGDRGRVDPALRHLDRGLLHFGGTDRQLTPQTR
jgi:hypothetical protein